MFLGSYLAHACCALSLLSLLFSTFTQQLISLEVLPAKTQAPLASIPRSEEWAQYTGAWDEGGWCDELTRDQQFVANALQTCFRLWTW